MERGPITGANVGAATSGPEISEEEHEVTLYEERPIVQKEVQPVKRVRLAKETVTGEETVSDRVRKTGHRNRSRQPWPGGPLTATAITDWTRRTKWSPCECRIPGF